MNTADRIFALTKERKMKQNELAEKIGAFASTVSGWKVGKTKSYKNYLPKIAEVLGTSVDYLLTGDTKSDPTTVFDDEAALNAELISRLCRLTPEELSRVDAFVQGLIAAR